MWLSPLGNRQVFEDFAFLSEATLRALPDQVRAAGATALRPTHLAWPRCLSGARSRYDSSWLGADRIERVWQYFDRRSPCCWKRSPRPFGWGSRTAWLSPGLRADILPHFPDWASSAGR
ncbi:MAG: hypothetical protein U0401_20290 [Anaerolineae bacterium]